jgi:MoaA/NifB/PqqE/SkfB family radical SAM enzyme
MSLALFRRLLGDLRALGGTRQVDLVGIGEPLLHPDCLEMAAAVKEAGFRLGLATNGSLLAGEKARRLAEIGVDKLHVSINSGSEEVYQAVHPTAPAGARRRILEALVEMNRHCDRERLRRPRVALSAVVFKQTYLELPALVRAAAEVGAGDVVFIPMGAVAETKSLALEGEEWPQAREVMRAADQQARELGMRTNAAGLLTSERPDMCREIYRRISCYAGHTFSLVFADGQVRFCCGCDRGLGNLHEASFRELWRGRAYAEMRRLALDLPRSGEAPERCACFEACPHRPQNIATHNRLYPGHRIPVGEEQDGRG